ncbi:MAG TPA: VWA domain-containing protein [Thermoanaerobaculia bacterium]|nr:VWA domain-containing protein [Thermoanaerobaculia bacterium]
MKPAARSPRSSRQSRPDLRALRLAAIAILLWAVPAFASQQLVLTRGKAPASTSYLGVVDLLVDPGIEDARVWISVDGQKIAEGLGYPYRVSVDLGPMAVEHKIAVTVIDSKKRRIRWQETVNRGHLPLTVRVTPVSLAARLFEAKTTAPQSDPVVAVELWHEGKKMVEVTEEPFRFEVPEEILSTGFVQVTARTKAGNEAADFWSTAGAVHVESIQVRTVPIFVSVVDRNGTTHDDVDRALFRIMDNETEGKIVEFGNAFDQPISIALLLDASASMTYSMEAAAKAANEFVTRTLKPGDRCSVTAIQDVPRRKQPLTDDPALVATALHAIEPTGRTALYDAIASAIRELKDEQRRRAIIALTDGEDTESLRSFDEIEKEAIQAGIPIYFLAYNTGLTSQKRDVERLNHLATQTGGFVALATTANLLSKYGEIERDLRAQFAILYQVTDFVRPKEWRRVRVTLASPKLTARTIRGYFTP